MNAPTNLSQRIRPNSEAAPWVVEEVKAMEAQREQLIEALSIAYNYLTDMTHIALVAKALRDAGAEGFA